MGKRFAFTLIELLVVISIIALLIAILLPTLASARRGSEEIQCGVDQRSLGQAAVTYAVDNKAVLPDLGVNPGNNTLSTELYITFNYWKKAMEDYGANRQNWYSVTNDAWNRDDFYDPQPGDPFAGRLVYGRFYMAGSLPNSAPFASAFDDAGSIDLADSRRPFAVNLEDPVQVELLWTDINRIWPVSSGEFITPGDPNRKGANHLGEDLTRPIGSHATLRDGSTVFVRGSEMEPRGTRNITQYWW